MKIDTHLFIEDPYKKLINTVQKNHDSILEATDVKNILTIHGYERAMSITFLGCRSNDYDDIFKSNHKSKHWKFKYILNLNKEKMNILYGNSNISDYLVKNLTIWSEHTDITVLTDTEQEYKACITLSKKL